MVRVRSRARRGGRALQARKATVTASEDDLTPLSAPLSSMPLDIIFEFLGYLSPRELLNLAHTSKGFRQVIASPAANALWKAATERASDWPDCPPFMSELQWADLLWGEKCQQCGLTSALSIDFTLLRRCCGACKKKHLVGTAALKERFPDFDTSIVEFVPYADVTTWGRGSATRTRMYWDTDVHDMLQRLSALENAIQMGQPNAHKKLQEFKTAQTDRVHEILKHADISDQLPGLWRSKTEILGFLRTRLIYYGHHERDVMNAVSANSYRVKGTSMSWGQIFRLFEGALMREIHSARTHRAHMEAQQADEAWKRKARELYADYCKRFTHRRVIYMPPVDHVLASRFSLYNESAAKAELRRLIANWTTDREQKLSGLIPMPEYLNFVTARQALRLAKLATAVFICTRCTVDPSSRSDILLLDHDQSILHANGCDLSFSSRGALAVESLVKSLGLYVRRTVPRNLDHIDARFICLRCKPVKGLNYRACPSLTWRQCVAHFVDPTLEVSHATPNWRRLNEGEEAAVKARQGPDSALSSRIWTCNHCDQFDFKTHCSAVTHVKAKHAIHHPAEGPDFFCDPRKSRPGPRKGLIVVDPSPSHGNGDGEAYICL